MGPHLNVLEFKHVSLDERLLDLFTGPGDIQLVVVVGLCNEIRSAQVIIWSNNRHKQKYYETSGFLPTDKWVSIRASDLLSRDN